MKRSLLVASLTTLASLAPAQDLLQWNAWKLVNSPLAVLELQPNLITLQATSKNGQDPVIFEQTVTTPFAGQYQFHFRGSTEAATGKFTANWQVGTKSFQADAPGFESAHQVAATVILPKGETTVRFVSSSSNLPIDRMAMPQPVLRPVTAPTVELQGLYQPAVSRLWTLRFSAEADVFLIGAQRTAQPIGFPGFLYGLEIDLTSPYLVAAIGSNGRVSWTVEDRNWQRGTLPHGNFFIQAIRLGSSPAFGSRLWVTGDVYGQR